MIFKFCLCALFEAGVWGKILEDKVFRTPPHPLLHTRYFLKIAKVFRIVNNY